MFLFAFTKIDIFHQSATYPLSKDKIIILENCTFEAKQVVNVQNKFDYTILAKRPFIDLCLYVYIDRIPYFHQ